MIVTIIKSWQRYNNIFDKEVVFIRFYWKKVDAGSVT